MLDTISQELNKLGFYEINTSESEYTENPKHLKLIFYIDTKYAFVEKQEIELINSFRDYGRLDVSEFVELCNGNYLFYTFIYEDGKITTDADLSVFANLRLFKSIEYWIKPILDKFMV